MLSRPSSQNTGNSRSPIIKSTKNVQPRVDENIADKNKNTDAFILRCFRTILLFVVLLSLGNTVYAVWSGAKFWVTCLGFFQVLSGGIVTAVLHTVLLDEASLSAQEFPKGANNV